MSRMSVGWSHYEGLANMGGFDAGAQDANTDYGNGFMGGGDSVVPLAEVDALNKALTAGADIDNPGSAAGEGFPLRTESLDRTLFNVTYSAKQIKFWKALAKDRAYNTVEEFNRLEAYGSGDSIFIPEGSLPVEDDSTYSRQYTKIKFMGTTRRITHVMTTIRAAHGNAMAREVVNGTLFLLRQLERALFTGDEEMIAEQFDGLETLLVKSYGSTLAEDGQYLGYEDDNVIDLRDQPLSEDVITDAAELIQAEPNYGSASDLWIPTGPMKDLSKILYPKERYDLPGPKNGVAGLAINGIRTPFGDISLNGDIFIPDSTTPNASGLGNAAQRPGAPTVGAPTSPAYAGSNTTYWGSTDAGSYIYKIVAGSRYGKSTPTTTASVTVSSGDYVTMTVTDAGPNTTYYEVFRSSKGGAASTCRTIMRVKRTAPSQNIVDLNRFLPNTSKGYMLTQTSEVLKWKQLAPFQKMNLATIDTSIRWMQILYGALQIMKPRQNVIFINVGKLPTGLYA